ncbi:MAG TPA: outer membrane protein assembly factor BamA [Candidatus Limnocylindria bacterium]|nr:outer membrane protein assembly factor BamA [Candidatus Limnocylindria bacterium]
MTALRRLVLVLALALTGAGAAAAQAPLVTAIDIRSPHVLDEHRVRAAIGDLAGRPRERGAVRESIVRLWALGLFSEVRVEETAEAGGVRLRYVLARRPHVREVTFEGDLGLDVGEVAAAVPLARGSSAEPARLERAREGLRALYEREGFLAARVTVASTAEAATNARDVVIDVRAGERARVGRVRVLGAERLGADFVEKSFGVKEGGRYGQAAVREGVEAVERRYRERGFFEARVEARRSVDPGRRRVDIDLVVVEGGHTRIEFDGVHALDQRRLHERFTFADTRAVDEPEVRASALQVAALYRESGYAFVEVQGRIVPAPPDTVVRFTVTEGPRVRVEAVEFSGSPLPEPRLRAAIATRPRGLLTAGLFRRDAAVRDADALAALLRAEGFPDAAVAEPRITFSDDRTAARVAFTIDAGPRVTVGEVRIAGDAVFPPDELRGTLPLRPGGPWSERAAQDGRRVLERRYAQRGYLAAAVEVVSERRDGVVDVAYRTTPGEPTRIGRVLVGGLVQTREHVVRRELPFEPGDPFNPEALVEAQRKLGDVRVFERVEVEPLRPAPAPFTDVTVTVRERKPWHLDFGVGYSTFEGARAVVEVGHDNLFGTGRTLTLRQRVSERGDRSDVIYGEPWLLGSRWRGDGTLFRERLDELGYDLERIGVALAARRPIFEDRVRGLRTALRYELSDVDRFNVVPALVEEDVTPGRQRIATVTPELALDRRDAPLDPSRGSFHLAALRVGSAAFGSDADFVLTRLETHWFFDWLAPTVIATSARLGFATPVAGDASLPIEERFFAGGAGTVRGYPERRLGPLDARGNPVGGNGLAIFNVEARFPLWRWLGGTVFFDTGAVTPEVEDLGPDDLRSGIGVGLRLTTPVGPVRADVGYPLQRIDRHAETLHFYLSVGHPF